MDQRLEKALDFSNYMVTLNNQKRVLTEQFKQDIIHYYCGGQFTVTQELISFKRGENKKTNALNQLSN